MKLPTDNKEIAVRNSIPDVLKNSVREDKLNNPLKRTLEAFQNIRDAEVWPTNLDCKVVHKVILATENHKLLDGPNNDHNRYIGFIAIGKFVSYQSRDILNQVFVMSFPIKAFEKMFTSSVMRSVADYFPSVLELHFTKVSAYRYNMKYLAVVEHKEDKTFERKIIEYRAPGYKPD